MKNSVLATALLVIFTACASYAAYLSHVAIIDWRIELRLSESDR